MCLCVHVLATADDALAFLFSLLVPNGEMGSHNFSPSLREHADILDILDILISGYSWYSGYSGYWLEWGRGRERRAELLRVASNVI